MKLNNFYNRILLAPILPVTYKRALLLPICQVTCKNIPFLLQTLGVPNKKWTLTKIPKIYQYPCDFSAGLGFPQLTPGGQKNGTRILFRRIIIAVQPKKKKTSFDLNINFLGIKTILRLQQKLGKSNCTSMPFFGEYCNLQLYIIPP